MDAWDELLDDSKAVWVKCRVLKQIGSDLFEGHRVGEEIFVDANFNFQQMIDEGYLEVIDGPEGSEPTE